MLFLEDERRSRNAKRRKLEDAERQQNSQRYNDINASVPPVASTYPLQRNAYRGPPLPTPAEAAQKTRAANLSAAAALRAELMKGFEDTGSKELSVPGDKPERGVKRKAEEVEEDEEEDDSIVPDGPDNAEDLDLEARGKAILERVAADKKKAQDAAREREPDDAVRYVAMNFCMQIRSIHSRFYYSLWESGWKERYYRIKFGLELSDQESIRQ